MLVILVAAFAHQPSAAQEQVTLRFVHNFSDANDIRGQLMQDMIDTYMAANPNVQIEVQSDTVDYEQILTNTLLATTQGNPPNLVVLDETSVQLAIDSEQFIPFASVISEEQQAVVDDLLPTVRDYYSVDGQLYALPWVSGTPVMYFNQSIFDEAGISQVPTTFEEISAACETIMAARPTLQGCINWPMTAWVIENWLAMQNAPLVNSNNGYDARATESFLDSPEMLTILEWWDTLSDNGYYGYTGAINDYLGEAIGFVIQQYAMHINSSEVLTNFQFYGDTFGYEVGVIALPKPSPDSSAGLPNSGANFWLPIGQSDAELAAAVDFAFFLMEAENQIAWHEATGYFPNQQSVLNAIDASAFWVDNPGHGIGVLQLIGDETQPSTAGARMGPGQQVRRILLEAVQSTIDQGTAPAEALAAAKRLADAELADYHAFYEE